MMFNFEKYHGNGNDFIIINDINGVFIATKNRIRQLCHRRFGIGADGLMLVQADDSAQFKMLYYNSDGLPATMCGNGGRCIAAYAYSHKLAGKKMIFNAVDGQHKAVINAEKPEINEYDVSLEMVPVTEVIENKNSYFINTGSPHHVEFVKYTDEIDVFAKGREIRNRKVYQPQGTNVDFVQIDENTLYVRTYERGVEDETLSCGTGVTASALAAFLETGKKIRRIKTQGGSFSVDFKGDGVPFTDIWLRGAARMVFKGETDL